MNQGKLDLPEIYGIWHTPFYQTFWGIFLLVLASLAVLGLIYLIYKIFSKKKKVSYWIRAENELNELLFFVRSESLQKTAVESNKVYTKLTSILKNYIQNRYNYFKYGLTDFELLEYLKNEQIVQNGHGSELFNIILTIFQNAQEAKFAHAEIVKSKIEADIQSSIKFIDLTKPKEKKENNIRGGRPRS